MSNSIICEDPLCWEDVDEIIEGKLYAGPTPAWIRKPPPQKIDIIFRLHAEEMQPIDVTNLSANTRTEAWGIRDCSDEKEAAIDVEKLNKIVDHLRFHLRAKRRVYVHCMQGVSRTSLVLAAFFMKVKKLPVMAALREVGKKRPCIRPNGFFLQLLRKYQQHLGISE